MHHLDPADSIDIAKGKPLRRAVLDLAPLELDCMNTLWPMGEGTVREIRDRLAPRRPRAYTTIMTILDRLVRKGKITRRKVGRAYLYAPAASRDTLRRAAIRELLDTLFDGSEQQLIEFLQPPRERVVATAPTGPPAEDNSRIDTVLL